MNKQYKVGTRHIHFMRRALKRTLKGKTIENTPMYPKFSSTNLDTSRYQSSSNPCVALYWFIYYIVGLF